VTALVQLVRHSGPHRGDDRALQGRRLLDFLVTEGTYHQPFAELRARAGCRSAVSDRSCRAFPGPAAPSALQSLHRAPIRQLPRSLMQSILS